MTEQIDPTTDPLYGVEQVADMFGVGEPQVRVWIKDGKLNATKVLGRWRVPKSEIIRLANEEHG